MIVMVHESDTVQSAVGIVAQRKVDILFFQLGDKIILACGRCHCIGHLPLCGLDVDFLLVTLELTFDSGSTRKLAESGCFQRCGYGIAVVIRGEIYQTVILTPIDFAVGHLASYIIQSEYGVIFADALELPAHTNQFYRVLNLTLDVAIGVNLGPALKRQADLSGVCGQSDLQSDFQDS